MADQFDALKLRLARLADLDGMEELLGWDQRTMMPAAGAEQRGNLSATLDSIVHELLVDPATERLIAAAEAELAAEPERIDDIRMVELARQRWEKTARVPAELAEQRTLASVAGHEAWAAARAASDFDSFVPFLERNVELARRYASCFEDDPRFETPYDALLDDFDSGLSGAEVRALLSDLEVALVPFLQAVDAEPPIDDRPLGVPVSVEAQRALSAELLRMMGGDERGWRIDDALHPFAAVMGTPNDVRVTSRYSEDYWPTGLLASMHEIGHGLYEAGIDPALARTPLGTGVSMSVHESQSRIWENMVGRGRPFAEVLVPMVAAKAGAALEPEPVFRALNRVGRDPIRVQSDEVTYALHIALRTELEGRLIDGSLAVRDLRDAWNARFHELVGVEVTDDADGVLQDVHWGVGLFGYFPTYAIGNIFAGQLWERARDDLPGLDEQLAAGELSPFREWLRDHVHRHGARLPTRDLVQAVTGRPLAVDAYVGYLREKLVAVYGPSLDARLSGTA